MVQENPNICGRTRDFVQHLTGCQSQLHAFICTALGGTRGARDVLQETNLVLWEKAGDFDPERPFAPWAYRFAYMQVLAYRKRNQRSRWVFDDELLEQVAEEFDQLDATVERQLEVLGECLGELPERQRELVNRRYVQGDSVNAIAAAQRRSPNTVAAGLYRIRKALLKCVQFKLAAEGHA